MAEDCNNHVLQYSYIHLGVCMHSEKGDVVDDVAILLFTSERENAVPVWACNLAIQMVCVLNKSCSVRPLPSSGMCYFTSPLSAHNTANTHVQ